MTTHNDNRAITATTAALELARAYRDELLRWQPERQLVIGFSWAVERRMREPNGGPMRDLGPGLDLAAYDRRHVDASRLRRADDFVYIVDVPAAVASAATQGVIDRDDREFSQLILR